MLPSKSVIPSLLKTAKLALAKATSSLKTGLLPIYYPSIAHLQPSYIPLTNQSNPNSPSGLRDRRKQSLVDRHHFSTWCASSWKAGRSPFSTNVSTQQLRSELKHPESFSSPRAPGSAQSARYFSHGQARHAQVLPDFLTGPVIHSVFQNSARSRKAARFAPATTEHASRPSSMQLHSPPVSYVDFRLAPSITSVGYLSSGSGSQSLGLDLQPATLDSEDLINALQVDFSRAETNRKMILDDIRRLSGIGGLPIGMSDSATLRVLFPDRTRGSVEALCDDLGIVHGVVGGPEEEDVVSLDSGFETLPSPQLPAHPMHPEHPLAPMEADASWEDLWPSSRGNDDAGGRDEALAAPASIDWLDMLSGNTGVNGGWRSGSRTGSDMSFLSDAELASEEHFFFPTVADESASGLSATSSDSGDGLQLISHPS